MILYSKNKTLNSIMNKSLGLIAFLISASFCCQSQNQFNKKDKLKINYEYSNVSFNGDSIKCKRIPTSESTRIQGIDRGDTNIGLRLISRLRNLETTLDEIRAGASGTDWLVIQIINDINSLTAQHNIYFDLSDYEREFAFYQKQKEAKREPLKTTYNPELPKLPTETSLIFESEAIKPIGKYYGLFIGVSNYLDPSLSLDQPVNDARSLKDILISKYEFEKGNAKLLEDPTRQEILSELKNLRSIITSNDNLLIFFAGHGYFDKAINQGYWWPKDAKKNDQSNWLSNSDIKEQIRGINSGHTLLISDACFSGAIFKSRGQSELNTAPVDIKILYRTRSRRAITSGNLSTVPDQSVFLNYLSNRLVENNEEYLTAQALFNSLKSAVISNSLNIPQEGVIFDSGDEGGDFIFIRKRN